MKLIFLVIFFSIFFWTECLGTAQVPDRILFQGKMYSLHSNPLEFYVEKFPAKRPTGGNFSTANWRGYIAEFKIENNMLILNDIYINKLNQKEDGSYQMINISVKKEVFPDLDTVLIDWYTGILVIPHGRRIKYAHMGYGSTYNRYILLEIENGNLTNYKHLRRKQYARFREEQFQAFKKTDEYKVIVEELQSENTYNEQFIDDFLRLFIINYTSKFLDK